MSDEERYEHTYLHSSGPLPGFPGAGYGPGPVVLDKQERKVYDLSEWEAMQAAIAKAVKEAQEPEKEEPKEDDKRNAQADVL